MPELRKRAARLAAGVAGLETDLSQFCYTDLKIGHTMSVLTKNRTAIVSYMHH